MLLFSLPQFQFPAFLFCPLPRGPAFLDLILLIWSTLSILYIKPLSPSINSSVLILFLTGKVIWFFPWLGRSSLGFTICFYHSLLTWLITSSTTAYHLLLPILKSHWTFNSLLFQKLSLVCKPDTNFLIQ